MRQFSSIDLLVISVTVSRKIQHTHLCQVSALVTLRAAAAQCIVIGPVCGCVCVCVCLWVCYHDNSTLRESILNKLGL